MNFEYILVNDSFYCALCDKYFADSRQRREHIAESVNHPECQVCGGRFLNGDILRKVCLPSQLSPPSKDLLALYLSAKAPLLRAL